MVTFNSTYWAPGLEVKIRRRQNENDNNNNKHKTNIEKSSFAPAIVNNLFSNSIKDSDTESDENKVSSPEEKNSTLSKKNSLKKQNNKHEDSDFMHSVKATWKDLLSTKNSKNPSKSSVDGRKTEKSFTEKYGLVDKKAPIGRGATAVVRVSHKNDSDIDDKAYAIKEFRKKRKEENEREYIKKLTSEFCISSTLKHPNVVETIDLIKDEQGNWCEVMEYCPGGDLYYIIKNGNMGINEINCCFKQLINGLAYLHSMGVAHRDIKPENLLINENGQLKITDFGVSDVFRMVWESSFHKSKGLCGSEPYIAPEQFICKEYDARNVDIWASGVVYYTMMNKSIPFRRAKNDDPHYLKYLECFDDKSFESFNKYSDECKELMYRILDPDPIKRITIEEIKENKWFKSIKICVDDPDTVFHQHFTFDYNSKSVA